MVKAWIPAFAGMTRLTLLSLPLLIGLAMGGCQRIAGVYGQPLSGQSALPIGTLLSAPKKFEGKTVTLEGKIVEECPTGGWFMLKDDTGLIFVDLHPSDLAIPQAVGHKTVAEGTVLKEGQRITVIGKGVELK
ncbi:MAG: hypothetical protein LHV69_08170 [Elusimicrobia bacterium]|nr:hypothetical protein [Candidatus Obscuribacterium magneticum]